MNKLSLVIIVLLAMASLSIPLWQNHRIGRLQSEIARLQSLAAEIEPLRQKIKTISAEQLDPQELKRLRDSQSEVLRLRARLTEQTAHMKESKGKGVVGGKESTDQRVEPLAKQPDFDPSVLRELNVQGLVNKVGKVRSRLKMNGEQYNEALAIAQSYSKAAENPGLDPSSDQPPDTTQKVSLPEFDQRFRALLSPEQISAYDEMEDELKNQNFRQTASTLSVIDLHKIQQVADLTPAQITRATEILTEYNIQKLDWAKYHPDSSSDIYRQRREQADTKAKALEEILDSIQLENLRKTQEIQQKLNPTSQP